MAPVRGMTEKNAGEVPTCLLLSTPRPCRADERVWCRTKMDGGTPRRQTKRKTRPKTPRAFRMTCATRRRRERRDGKVTAHHRRRLPTPLFLRSEVTFFCWSCRSASPFLPPPPHYHRTAVCTAVPNASGGVPPWAGIMRRCGTGSRRMRRDVHTNAARRERLVGHGRRCRLLCVVIPFLSKRPAATPWHATRLPPSSRSRGGGWHHLLPHGRVRCLGKRVGEKWSGRPPHHRSFPSRLPGAHGRWGGNGMRGPTAPAAPMRRDLLDLPKRHAKGTLLFLLTPLPHGDRRHHRHRRRSARGGDPFGKVHSTRR